VFDDADCNREKPPTGRSIGGRDSPANPGNRLINAQAEAGIAQQTKLQGKAQLVPRATFGERFLKIIRGQSVVLDQVCFIDRYQEELIRSSSVSKLRRPITMPLASLTMQGIPTRASANIPDFVVPISPVADQWVERFG